MEVNISKKELKIDKDETFEKNNLKKKKLIEIINNMSNKFEKKNLLYFSKWKLIAKEFISKGLKDSNIIINYSTTDSYNSNNLSTSIEQKENESKKTKIINPKIIILFNRIIERGGYKAIYFYKWKNMISNITRKRVCSIKQAKLQRIKLIKTQKESRRNSEPNNLKNINKLTFSNQIIINEKLIILFKTIILRIYTKSYFIKFKNIFLDKKSNKQIKLDIIFRKLFKKKGVKLFYFNKWKEIIKYKKKRTATSFKVKKAKMKLVKKDNNNKIKENEKTENKNKIFERELIKKKERKKENKLLKMNKMSLMKYIQILKTF